MRLMLLLSLLATVGFQTGCNFPRFEHERVDRREFETSPLNSVDISTFNGGIEVVPHDRPVVEMEITFKGYGETEEAAVANCEALSCEPTAEEGVLFLKAEKPAGHWMAHASFKLKVPANVDIKATTSNGRVTIKDLAANVDVHTSNGTVTLANVADAKVKTSNGRIEVSNAAGTVNLGTSNGSIKYSGMMVGKENRMTSSNGTIKLELNPLLATKVESRTSNGKIKCSLDKQLITKESKRALEAILGSGDPKGEVTEVYIKTSNGSISIDPLQTSDESIEIGSDQVAEASLDAEVNSEISVELESDLGL
ncbi:MAG: DUF4097 family beta strand repeat-containing protein [Planctomycetota bacterium]